MYMGYISVWGLVLTDNSAIQSWYTVDSETQALGPLGVGMLLQAVTERERDRGTVMLLHIYTRSHREILAHERSGSTVSFYSLL